MQYLKKNNNNMVSLINMSQTCSDNFPFSCFFAFCLLEILDERDKTFTSFLYLYLSPSDSHTLTIQGTPLILSVRVNSVRSYRAVVQHPSHPSAPAQPRLQIVHSGTIFHDHLLLNLIS